MKKEENQNVWGAVFGSKNRGESGDSEGIRGNTGIEGGDQGGDQGGDRGRRRRRRRRNVSDAAFAGYDPGDEKESGDNNGFEGGDTKEPGGDKEAEGDSKRDGEASEKRIKDVLTVSFEPDEGQSIKEKGKIKAKPVKPKKTTYSKDKELNDRLVEAIKMSGEFIDFGLDYGLKLEKKFWQFDDEEAKVLARIILRRADAGSKAAIKLLESLIENLDYAQALLILVPRVIATVKEIIINAKPKVRKETENNTYDIQSIGAFDKPN